MCWLRYLPLQGEIGLRVRVCMNIITDWWHYCEKGSSELCHTSRVRHPTMWCSMTGNTWNGSDDSHLKETVSDKSYTYKLWCPFKTRAFGPSLSYFCHCPCTPISDLSIRPIDDRPFGRRCIPYISSDICTTNRYMFSNLTAPRIMV